MSEKIKYQKGILPNLLSGFYEQIELEKKDESHRSIFAQLRKEFENRGKGIVVTGVGLKSMQEISKDCFVSNKNPFAWFIIKNIKSKDKYRITITKLLVGETK